MTIFAENKSMELAFNKILQEQLNEVVPLILELGEFNLKKSLLKERMLEMLDQNYECFGVYIQEELVGVFGLWFMTRHYAGKTSEVDHVFIKKEYQNKGIGKKIFDFIETYTLQKGCEMSELNSYVFNTRSHKFYMNLGYEIKGFHFLKKLR